jgi:type VI secretion system protein ImpA
VKDWQCAPDDPMLKPIKFDALVGDDPRKVGFGQAIYRALRDARTLARSDERRIESGDRDGMQIGLSPAWSDVRENAMKILAEVGKDIEVMVWLIEAETRIAGYVGLARSANILNMLVATYGHDLHPLPDPGEEGHFDVIGGLNGIGREGTLVQPLRLLPVLPGMGFGQMTLWGVQNGDDAPMAADAMRNVGSDKMLTYLAEVTAARQAIVDCDTTLSTLLGPDAPPFAQLVAVLDDTIRTIRRLSGIEIQHEQQAAPARPTPAPDAAPEPVLPASSDYNPRDEALAELLRIAAFFHKSEPHSPISQSLETLVRRGRMDFTDLMAELIADDTARGAAMTTAGIRAPNRLNPTPDSQ